MTGWRLIRPSPFRSLSPGLLLGAVLVLGTCIRLWLIDRTPWQWFAIDRLFDGLGWHLAQGFGFTLDGATPSAHVGPLYPALLGAWYAIVGHRPEWVPYLHVGLDLLTTLFLSMAGRLLLGPGIGALAASLFYLYPAYWTYDLRIRNEILLTLLVTFWLWAAIRSCLSEKPLAYGVSGLVGGLAILCKPVLIPTALLFALVPSAARPGPFRRWLPHLAVYLGCLILVVAPWTLRNWHAFGKVLPVSAGVGVGLWMGSDPVSRGSWPMPLAVEAQIWETAGVTPLRYPHMLYEVEVDEALFAKGAERILAHPLTYLGLVGLRAVDLWIGNAYYLHNGRPTLWEGLEADRVERGALVAGYSLVKRLMLLPGIYLLALWACWANRSRWRTFLPLYLFPVGITLGYAPFTTEAGRYVLPVLPGIFLLATWSLAQLVIRLGAGKLPPWLERPGSEAGRHLASRL